MRFIGNVEKDAQVRAVASGALSTGDTVVVNSDGTVSVVEETSVSQATGSPTVFESADMYQTSAAYDTSAGKVVIAYTDRGNSFYGTAVVGTVSGTSISFGSPVVYVSSDVYYNSVTYDANAQKVVIGYRDGGNANRGTAVVGTVSGTSISFGSPAVFNSGGITSWISATYDSNAQKVVIAYEDAGNNDYGTAIVGTVSGTSISFGSETVFESARSTYIASAYDEDSQQVVIAYIDYGNSFFGTAIVGAVSGTSISFGTPTVFESGNCIYFSLTYDSNAQKVVIAYRDQSNSDYGTAIVGTVSGTSISFGSHVVFNTARSDYVSATYSVLAKKVVIGYRDGGNSNYGTIIVGNVSGTSISFGTEVVFEDSAIEYLSSAYDPVGGRVITAYRDAGNSDYGTSVVFQPAYLDTNLTSENFLGFAAHTYADTQNAVINSTCTVDRNQSGLTAGQKYYVQGDGTLDTTAADPSVEAGTAISSTEIIVKG